MKLGLGTVQFGLDYGITNRSGRTPLAEVRRILADAGRKGIDTLDTAALYGNAESVLGQALPRPHKFSIITKTLALEPAADGNAAIATVVDGALGSLERLGESRLAGLLIHRIGDLLGPTGDALYAALEGLRSAGKYDRIGVSVYTPEEAYAVLDRYPIDLIQLPLNPLDQRHLRLGSLAALQAAGVEIHVRSAFLQGLLLSAAPALPPGLAGLASPLAAWRTALQECELTGLQGCLGFLKGVDACSVVVCGATTLAEWQEIVAAFETAAPMPPDALKNLAVQDDKLIDPRYWSRH
ncbi:MAG: aldo/keto reductase [Azonexus sp.]